LKITAPLNILALSKRILAKEGGGLMTFSQTDDRAQVPLGKARRVEDIEVRSVPINWHTDLPIFASGSFLSTVSKEYGWIGGFEGTKRLLCVLPYTLIRKARIRLVRFQSETIPFSEDFSLDQEKTFLNKVLEFLRRTGADIIIPPRTSAIFPTFPEGAIAAPYATFIVDLRQTEEEIWRNINHTYRKDIQNAVKKGLRVRIDSQNLEKAYAIIRGTFQRSGLPFMDLREFLRLARGLGEHVKVFWAEVEGIPQSVAVFPFSQYCAYGVYGGSVPGGTAAAFKLIQWEAMKYFRSIGVRRYDLVGSRVNPEKGSKQEGLMLFKKRFGAEWAQGFMWKYPFSRWKYAVYQSAIRFQRGGDIVDQERHKLPELV
jgi:hypothetical protein